MGDTFVNELSVYRPVQGDPYEGSLTDISIAVHDDRVVLRGTQPFTLGRFRTRLQVNYTPEYAAKYSVVDDLRLTRRDAPTDATFKTYNNRYHDETYMATLDPAHYVIDDCAEREYAHFCKQDVRWQIARDAGIDSDDEADYDREQMHAAGERRYAAAAKWFKLGYAEMQQRANTDMQMLRSRPRIAAREWTLYGSALELKFFNGGHCDITAVRHKCDLATSPCVDFPSGAVTYGCLNTSMQ